MSVGALAEQHQRWLDARQRLFSSPPKAERQKRPRPVSPFARPVKRRLFTRAIEELDERGNVVIHGMFLPTWKSIAFDVLRGHEGVSFKDLTSARRDKKTVFARHECFWRCRKETGLTLPQIGKRFGGKDHTTVLHGIRMHEKRLAASDSPAIAA